MSEQVSVEREADVLRLRTNSNGRVYELCEYIDLDRWESRHWLGGADGVDAADIEFGHTAISVMNAFPGPVAELFVFALNDEAVVEARAEPVRRLRSLIDDGRWHEASKLSLKLSLDPYIADSRVDIESSFTMFARAAAQIAANEAAYEQRNNS
ncbi:hypothetical protein [Arthrobacter castelli]|uniref:hypothetical protein n=1 Tax=Arthrobacter castelli TaxID=271431 RepID=UPI00047A4667|nr:hypothetical protein [Arthrobacter castelli]